MTKIILFPQEVNKDNAPNYSIALPVKKGEEEKLVTVGAAWNKEAKSGTTFISIALKKDVYTKDDGTVYPAAKFTHKGIEFPFASIFKTKKDQSKVLLSLSRKDGEEYVNEFGSNSGTIVRGDDGMIKRIDVELNDETQVVLNYGEDTNNNTVGTKDVADQTWDELDTNKNEIVSEDVESIPF